MLLYNHCDYYQLINQACLFLGYERAVLRSSHKVDTTVPPGKQTSRNVATPPYQRHTCNYSLWTMWCNWQLRWCRQHSFYYLGKIAAGKVANLKIFQVSARLFSQVPEQYREQVRNSFFEVHGLTLTSTLHDQRTAEAHQPAILIQKARGTRLITKLPNSDATQWLIVVFKTDRNCTPSSYQLI